MTNKNPLDKAITKSRNKEAGIIDVQDDGAIVALAELTSTEGMTQTFSVDDLIALARSGEVEVAERIIEIKEGMMIKGQLTGPGVPAEVLDQQSGLPRKVNTWRMTLESGVRVSFLSSAQLDRMLPEFVGRKGITTIARGGEVKTKRNRNMAEFYVFGPKANAPRLLPAVVEVKAGT